MDKANPGRRYALVTGGARGIGLAIAERLGRDGVTPILGDIDGGELHEAQSQLRLAGCEAHGIVLNVASEPDVHSAFDVIAQRFGQLDIVVNNAGIMPRVEGRNSRVEETPLDVWERTLAVNLTGPFLVCRSAIALLRQSRAGRVINIASRAARMSTSGNSHYSASKAGLVGFSRVLAKELGPHGITVNCIAPSAVDTAMHAELPNAHEHLRKTVSDSPLGRLAVPQDIAGAVAFLASEESAFITGAIIDVNGGTYMP